MEAWMKHGCRKWFSSFYSRKYWKVWAGSKAIVHSPSLLPVCCVHPYVWKLMTWHCWIMFFLHKIWCGTSRSRTCSTGHSASVGSASPSSTSTMFISCPVSEDPKGHFCSYLKNQRLVFWDPAPAHSFLLFQVAAVPDSTNSYSLLHPCLCLSGVWGTEGLSSNCCVCSCHFCLQANWLLHL